MSVLEVHDVSIRYMTGDFKDIGLKEYLTRKLTGNYRVVEFWADHHITFSLEKGDMLGIVGTNGAGKSTLLKAISGIMEPTGGYVKREGNIAALLELASGFDGDLTVRENTYLRGAMLGYTRKFMDEKYPEIIEFAELQDFQDRPFKQLSSGMMSRLAFSVASLVHPDILILDEVLSVGDGAFRRKSEAKMREIINSGATTILVSHSVEQVREMCNKVLWIEKGNQIGFGETNLLCDLYQGYLDGTITLDEAKAQLGTIDVIEKDESLGTESSSELISAQKKKSSKWTGSFLAQRRTEMDWDRKKKAAYYTYRMLLVIFTAFLLSIVLLYLAAGGITGFKDYFLSWKIIALNTVPIVLLAVLLYGVTGRAWSGLLLGGGAAAILGLVNYYKLNFRNDPLRMEDLFLFREAANMASGGYTPFIDGRIAVTIIGLIGLTGFLYFAAPGKLSQWKKRGIIVVIAATLLAMLTPVYRSQAVYVSVKNEYANKYNPIESYIYRGFVYPFLYSVNDMIEAPLSGYSAGKAEELLDAYEDADIPEDRKISVIAVMREAYADLSQYNILGLDASVYDAYHALEAESYVGDMVSNTFGGGTTNAERGFLTGNYLGLRNYRSNFNSYVWYLRQQGYTTEGSHPYYSWFYSRNAINGLMGFENYRFYEDDYENLDSSKYVSDAVLLSEIYQDFQKNKTAGKPYFSFSITIQSHGPYKTYAPAQTEYLTGDSYSVECRNAVNHYLSTIADMDQELIKLVEQLRFDPEPVVLITFGDHMPWMGGSNAFYDEMGLNIQCDQEGSMYSTRYLIWANETAKEILGHDVQGKGPTISPCYLMNLLFRQMDWKGPAFLQAMDDMMEVFPVIHTLSPEHYVVDGIFTAEIPEERRELFDNFRYLQKYWRSKYLFAKGMEKSQTEEPQSLRQFLPQKMEFILHAGGVTPEGVLGSNSLEALNYSYGQGYRNIEMDFCWTGDRDLACVHDWGKYGSEVARGTIEQFNEIRGSRFGYTSMTLDHLAQWLEDHPDVLIITDIKEDNVEGATLIAQRYPDLMDQFVIQIYHYDEYRPVVFLGFKNIILTVYKMAWEEKTNEEALGEFIRTHRLVGLTFPEVLLERPMYGNMTFARDVPLYVHTVNDGELQKRYLDMGISGIYTDVGKAF